MNGGLPDYTDLVQMLNKDDIPYAEKMVAFRLVVSGGPVNGQFDLKTETVRGTIHKVKELRDSLPGATVELRVVTSFEFPPETEKT